MIGRPEDHSSKLARGELADPEHAERLEAENPDEHLRRRDFLGRTAALAGSAALATMLPSDTLVAEAAKKHRHRIPAPHNVPVDTVVVLMMENRSFDHYFGWFPKADGKNTGLSYPDPAGTEVPTHHLDSSSDFQGCEFRDPDHSWFGGRFQYDGGKMDNFVKGNQAGTGSDSYAAGYFLKQDLPFIPHAAKAFTLYDRWFCSIMDSTYPNRHYQWGAQDGGTMGNKLPSSFNQGYTWETIFDRALSRGLSARYYYSDIPFSALYGTRGVGWGQPVSQFYDDAAAGKLPNIAFVDPAFLGEDNGISGDEHPHGDIRVGQAFMSDVVHAFMESPQYRRGVMFVDYDEWGGFFDHVKPRHVPDDRASSDLDQDYGFTGFRIPGVCVSPFSRKGGVNHMQVTHESILKFITYRFQLGYLNLRHRRASNIGKSLNFRKPRFEPPALPDPGAIAALPCGPQLPLDQQAARPKPHDLERLKSSGLLEATGAPEYTPSYDQLFRQPDTIRKALGAPVR